MKFRPTRRFLAVTGALVADAAKSAGGAEVRYHPELETLASALMPALRSGDVLVTLGAGSVEELGPAVLELLRGPGRGGHDA